jgi:hypothetical protein
MREWVVVADFVISYQSPCQFCHFLHVTLQPCPTYLVTFSSGKAMESTSRKISSVSGEHVVKGHVLTYLLTI